MIRKLSNIFFKVAGIGILILLIANIANSIILKSSIPDKFKDAKWEGSWESGSISLIGGKIIANLPDKIPNNETFEVDLMIYYNIWSIYKMGEIKEFKLTGRLGDDNSGSGENMTNENRASAPGTALYFKANIFGSGDQKIEYSGIADRSKTQIAGGYKSSYPGDLGNFIIRRKW